MPEKESQRESACACVREREAGRETDRERSACAHTHRESGVRGHLVLTLGRGILHVQLQRTRPWIYDNMNQSRLCVRACERAPSRGKLLSECTCVSVSVCVCTRGDRDRGRGTLSIWRSHIYEKRSRLLCPGALERPRHLRQSALPHTITLKRF